jgi:ATP-dependent helicase/nuclease subunit B
MRFIHPSLVSWLDSGATVVTPTPLLAAVIQRQYAETQLRERRSWQQPSVLSLGAWFHQLWGDVRYRSYLDVDSLLSAAQERYVWEQTIENEGIEVLDRGAAARAAIDASKKVIEWQVPLDHPAWSDHEDAKVFHDCLTKVRSRCAAEGWLRSADLWQYVPGWLSRDPKRIIFAGFREKSRALRTLSARIGEQNSVEFAEIGSRATTAVSVRCGDFEGELDAAARWARARVEDNSSASVGLVCANLRQHSGMIERTLRQVLSPRSLLEPVSGVPPAASSAFHLRAGRSLICEPVIASALALIEFFSHEIPASSLSVVLRSPFISGSVSERLQRAQLDARLRKLREPELRFSTIEKFSSDCGLLGAVWLRLGRVIRSVPDGPAEPARWTGLFAAALDAAGWPGDTLLSSQERETAKQWEQVLSAFASLGFVGAEFTLREAIEEITSMLANVSTVIGDLNSPVQVLDPREAVSFRFDRLWISGGSEADWSVSESPSPFIPLSLQRAAGIPAPTPSGRREEAARTTRFVETAGEQCVVSYSGSSGTDVRISPLFSVVEQRTTEDLFGWKGKVPAEQVQFAGLESVEDGQGPALATGAAPAGGTHILKSQSACPFQAFARWRLAAEPWEDAVSSFDARDRGMFLHDALAKVWATISTQERLLALPSAELREIVANSIEAALASDVVSTNFREQLRRAEAERLRRVIEAWLEIEKTRQVPFSVRRMEEDATFQLSQLPIRIRADRVDELKDGRVVIIDYKSGLPKQSHLDGERPDEPQMLVYAAAFGAAVDGIYFAQLKCRSEKAVGYGCRNHFKIKAEIPQCHWGDQLSRWSSVVLQLAHEFESGAAQVNPREKACQYCSIKPVCRIEEVRRIDLGD